MVGLMVHPMVGPIDIKEKSPCGAPLLKETRYVYIAASTLLLKYVGGQQI
jgi:hypothetical protein